MWVRGREGKVSCSANDRMWNCRKGASWKWGITYSSVGCTEWLPATVQCLEPVTGPNEALFCPLGWGVIDVCALPTHHVVSAVGPLSSYQETMVKAFLPYLVDPHPLSVRKRAYIALCESGVKTLLQTSSAVIAYH